jgi:hypothetical protein
MYNIKSKKRSNSKKFDLIIFTAETDDEIIGYLKRNNLRVDHIPYIFTHIVLSNGQIITQDFRGIICSPQRLAGKLQAQGLS